MTRIYLRLAWIIGHILLEAIVGAVAVLGLSAAVWPYVTHRPQGLDHPALVIAILLATAWIALGPAPYRLAKPSDPPTKAEGAE